MPQKKVEWYHDFIDTEYLPDKTDLIALYYFEPSEGVKIEDVVGRLASESSVGTWTTLETLDDRIFNMRGRAYWYNDHYVKIAFPFELWEPDNIPQLLSGIAGNIYGMKAVKNLRLMDAYLPPEYVNHYLGPYVGTTAIRYILKKSEGPITATVPKPKIGMTVEQHIKVAEDAWRGGIDIIKDDENLTNQNFNKFQTRVEKMSKIREKVEKETGDIKEAFINVTSETHEMEKRIQQVAENGFKYFMVDVLTCGFSALQSVRNLAKDYNMAIHAHRAMHAAFTKHETHGISMFFLAKILRLIGVDNLHIGTVEGKLDSPKEEVLTIRDLLLHSEIKEVPLKHLPQQWGTLKQTLPVASGGLHPALIPEVMKIYNTTNLVLQIGGGIHGHPDSTYAGAKAVIQAIDAFKEGITLVDMAKSHPELKKALENWGCLRPI